MRISILSLFLLALSFTAAGAAHHKGTLSSINVGTRFSSLIERRGTILYDDFQFDPVLAVFLFDDRLEYLGDSIGFRDFIYKDNVRLRSRFVQLSDDPLFPENKTIRNQHPDRQDTTEWSTALEIFLPGYNDDYAGEIDVTYSKDFVQHHGHYVEVLGKLKLFSFTTKLSGEIEPNFFVSTGWGSGAHNKYLYGKNSDGVTNHAAGLWFAFPDEADRFYPIIQAKYFRATGDFRNGDIARGDAEGILFSFIATVGLLD